MVESVLLSLFFGAVVFSALAPSVYSVNYMT